MPIFLRLYCEETEMLIGHKLCIASITRYVYVICFLYVRFLFSRGTVAGRQHRGCVTPQAVTHNLVLLKMGKIIAPNMLS